MHYKALSLKEITDKSNLKLKLSCIFPLCFPPTASLAIQQLAVRKIRYYTVLLNVVQEKEKKRPQ
jgi:hypothetical protein